MQHVKSGRRRRGVHRAGPRGGASAARDHGHGHLRLRPAESESAKKSLGLPKAYRDLDEVLADPKVDAVHLAMPNLLHYEFAKQAIEAGKHVMCEKPLAMNSAETAELVELAKRRAWPPASTTTSAPTR